MSTPRDLIHASLREIGVLAGGETASADEATDALSRLNRWIGLWEMEPLAIFTKTRSTFPIVASRGEYLIGPSAGTAHTDLTVTDGFDTAWVTAPDNWTDASTGAGTLSDETSVYQAGGHSVRLQPSSGTAAFRRDFAERPGNRVTITFYGYTSTADQTAGLIVQNTATTNYLSSDGTWQATETFCTTIPDPNNIFGAKSVTFNVEDTDVIGTVVGSAPCTIRVKFSSTGTVARVDTFTYTSRGGLQIPRPERLDSGDVRLVNTNASPDFETPLTMQTDAAWFALPQRAQTASQPWAWHYEPTMPNGTLNLFPVPTGSGFEIAVYVPTRVAQFSTLDDTVTLPSGYEEMIVQGLALRLCPSYGRRVTPELQRFADASMAAVKRSNARLTEMSFPAESLIGSDRGWYNIRTDR